MKFRLTAVFLVLGIILAVVGGKGLVTSVLPAKYIYDPECDWTKLKSGQRVYADVDFVIEPFEITSEDGRDVSAIYTIPDLKTADDGSVYMAHYMGILVNSKDFGTYNSMVDASWDWWDDTTGTVEWAAAGTIPFDGYLRKMNKKEKEFIHDYLKDWGYSESEIADMTIPYVMMKNQSFITYVLMFGGGIVLTIIGAIFGVLFFIKKPAGA